MNEQKNVQTVKDAYAAFGRRDIDGLLALMTDGIDWQTFGPDELPMSGRRKGKNEVRRFFQQVDEAWSFERFEPRNFIAQGDTVVALGYYSGKAKTTSQPFACDWAHVFTVKNGKVDMFREYTDTQNLIKAYKGATARV